MTCQGGESNDIFTDRVTLFGKKRRAGFALKGPAKKGALVPAKMGKNGDQIQRLFNTPASVFLVQYEGEVKESVYKLMEELAKARAITGGEIFWGVIDDDATKRLRKAYCRHKEVRGEDLTHALIASKSFKLIVQTNRMTGLVWPGSGRRFLTQAPLQRLATRFPRQRAQIG